MLKWQIPFQYFLFSNFFVGDRKEYQMKFQRIKVFKINLSFTSI